MGINPIFDAHTWAQVPFGLWAFFIFVFGCIVGSFLNVCIHRMPLGESIVSPPSHCPHCNYSIPWYLNIPLVTWLYLRGKCANCGAPISIRYFLVELLTGVAFLSCWYAYGHQSPLVALVYCILMAGLIVATFIDFEHFIIPDEITFGGMIVGFLCSLVVPKLYGSNASVPQALVQSMIGMVVGLAIVYAILRGGKLLFGRQKIQLEPGTKIIFGETALLLPDREIPYGDVLYRSTDTIRVQGSHVELCDRGYATAEILLTSESLVVAGEKFNPEEVPYLQVVADELVLPREAMGLGDVKFMAAIGAFLGWQAVVFSLMVSSLIGSIVGVTLIATKKKEWSSRLPYGPYIAVAAVIWMFGGQDIVHWWFSR